ncbi:MAG: response regulator transcription factor [Flavobacteriales bacterium]|nr:response regulator transcription factor [Flavobacteriales bacterium]
MKKPKTVGKMPKKNRPEPAVIRVAVADARKPMLIGLAQMVNALPGYRADVLVHDSAALLRACKAACPPDAVLVHTELEDGSGMQAVALLHKVMPTLPVLVLCERADVPFAQRVVGAGAAGLLPTRLEDGALCLALQDVHTVGFHMGTYLRKYLCGQQVKGLRSRERKGHGLTASELKVLQECADRARPSRREVAKRLKVGISTVTTHLKHIRAKWNVHDMGAMMRHAVRNEWVD